MKKLLLAGVAVAAIAATCSANAADIRPIYKAPPPAVVPPPSWTGCYVGVNGGWGWARSEFTASRNRVFPTGGGGGGGEAGAGGGGGLRQSLLGGVNGFEVDNDLHGGLFGGHVGCQYQWANWVFGVEVGADGADIKGSTTVSVPFPPSHFIPLDSFDTRVKWIATATPRVGFAWANWLYYVKGGLAAAQADVTVTRLNGDFIGDSFSDRESRVGWTVGTGLEWMFAPGWVLGVEYNFIDLGTDFHGGLATSTVGGVLPAEFNEDHKLRINEVLGRLSYKFDWGGAGVGRY
jgi:outer membrane immunogenic protein